MTRLPRALAVLLLPVLAACSSSGTTGTAKPTPDSNHALECGLFDTGTVYLNDVWPQITAGQAPAGFDTSLTKTVSNWQTVLDDNPGQHDALTTDVGTAIGAVGALQTAITAGTGSATPVPVGYQLNAVRNAYTAVAGDCTAVGYTLTQKLG